MFASNCQNYFLAGFKVVSSRLLYGRLQNSHIFCERGRPSICERKAVWSVCESGEGEWRETNNRCQFQLIESAEITNLNDQPTHFLGSHTQQIKENWFKFILYSSFFNDTKSY